MTSLLAAADSLSWPQAVVMVAMFALFAFIAWLMFHD